MAVAKALGKAAGRLGDDLEAPGFRIKRPTIRLEGFD